MGALVTGATGEIGGRVVELLLQRNIRPRIFVRNRAKAWARFGNRADVFAGDLADSPSLQAALGGVKTLFLVSSGPQIPIFDAAAAECARAVGVHLVKLSSMDMQQNIGTGVWHAQGEAAIRAAGIAHTFVQPTGFMSNALHWAPAIKAKGVVRGCTGEGKIPFIHPEDIAAVASKVLLEPAAYAGASLPITGPEALSYREMAQRIGAGIAKPIRFESIDEKEVSEQMFASGDSQGMVDAHLSIYRGIRDGRLATVSDGVERILGREPLRFNQWVRENLAAFS